MKWLNRICGKISLLCYLFCLYYGWHLCQYGGIRRHLPFLICGLSAFLLSFVCWLISRFCVIKGEIPRKKNRFLFWIEFVAFLLGTLYFAGRIVYAATPYHGALSWKLDEWIHKKQIKLTHNNVLKNGVSGMLEDLDESLDLPDELYIANPYEITFDKNGWIQTIEAFFYGMDEEGDTRTYLVSYDCRDGDRMTVWTDGEANETYEEDKRLDPMWVILPEADVKTKVQEWNQTFEAKVFELEYKGRGTFTLADGLEYLSGDADGDGMQTGISDLIPLENGGTVTGFAVALSAKDVDGSASIHYIMEPEYTSQQEIQKEEEVQQIEEAKTEESWSIDDADGTMYFFLDEETGWRLVVTDAAVGSRFYEMEKTTDGGNTWQKINQDPFGGSIGVTEGLVFFDETYGYAGLSGASQSYSQLYVTRDGGLTFEMIQLPLDTVAEVPETGQLLGFTAADYDYFYMPQETDGGLSILAVTDAGEQEGFLFRSEDQGHTWTYAGISGS